MTVVTLPFPPIPCTSLCGAETYIEFYGYTASAIQLMVGFGVSSISDSWDAFAQNVKGLEEYYHLWKNDIIPCIKGIFYRMKTG